MELSLDLPSELVHRLAGIPSLQAVILFGSYARGEADKRSDIDLLLIFDRKSDVKKVERKLLKVLDEFRALPLVFSKRSVDEVSKDPSFFYNVFREGYVLYKRPGTELLPAAIGREKQAIIYTYGFGSLPHAQKLKFNAALFTHTVKKKYRYVGLLERVRGEKLGNGAIMIPANAEREIDALFKGFGIAPKKHYIWEMGSLYR
jgi:predicted nucleotidyltransferase